MPNVKESIEVNVPVRKAYDQWTQFEQFPRFMHNVESVHQLDPTRLHWKANLANRVQEWDAEITEQIPDRRIAWRSTSGARNDGVVVFEALDETRCRVSLELHVDPDKVSERIGAALGSVAMGVHADLERFKEFVESLAAPTGAWRGEIRGGVVTRPV